MRIYGHSDDCIEVEGVSFREEYSLGDDSHLIFPSGLVIRCTFCDKPDEAWRFRVVKNPAFIDVEETGPNEDGDYQLEVAEEPHELRHCQSADGETRQEMEDRLAEFDRWDNLEDGELRMAFEAVRRLL